MTERLSVWMDGELESEQARQLLSVLTRDFNSREKWACYHLLGDTIRRMDVSDLGVRICAHLRNEPTFLLPSRYHDKPEKLGRLASAAWARVAAVAFIAFAGGMVLQSLQQNSPQIASGPLAEANPAGVLTDERARNYLIAHLPYSNSKALQGMQMYASADAH